MISLMRIKQRITTKETKLVECLLLFFVFSSFFMQYYVHFIQSFLLYMGVIVAGALGLFLLSPKRFIASFHSLLLLWYIAIAVIAVNIIRTPFNVNVYVDLVTFVACAVMVACVGDKKEVFNATQKLILCFSLYFAISVWFQMLFPATYKIVFANFLPPRPKNVVLNAALQNEGYTGFCTNPGYTAGHIAAGILLLVALFIGLSGKKRLLAGGTTVFLLISMFLTGKRAPCLIMVLVIFLAFFVTFSKKAKITALKWGLPTVGIVVALSFLGRGLLDNIPFFGRLYETVDGLFTGADVSNNRAILYQFGGELFSTNPAFGVGWCNFRRMGVGVITQFAELEAHNIYMQLLCETGIFGFLIIMTPIIVFLITSYKALVRARMLHNMKHGGWSTLLLFAFSYQAYFLLNGFFDNMLYDHNYLLLYFLAFAMVMTFLRHEKTLPSYDAQQRSRLERRIEKMMHPITDWIITKLRRTPTEK